MINCWLKKSPEVKYPSWKTLVEGLCAIGNIALAEKIAKDHPSYEYL